MYFAIFGAGETKIFNGNLCVEFCMTFGFQLSCDLKYFTF
jgi:hypothetical protein